MYVGNQSTVESFRKRNEFFLTKLVFKGWPKGICFYVVWCSSCSCLGLSLMIVRVPGTAKGFLFKSKGLNRHSYVERWLAARRAQ